MSRSSTLDQYNPMKQLLRLALPIMGANLLQTLYNLADTFFLGRLGKEQVSAPTIAFNIIMFLIVFAGGMGMAGTTLISQSKGKQDQDKVDYYVSQTFTGMLLLSILLGGIGLLLMRPILLLLQVPDSVYPYVLSYMRIIFMGLPFMFLSFILRSVLQGIGDSITPLKIQIVTIVLNVILDPLLIFGIGPFPALSVAGAAIATVIARFSGSVIALYILISGRKGVQLKKKYLKPRKQALMLIGKIGIPASIGHGISALGFTVLQGLVNTLGAAVIAAFGIGSRIINSFNMPAMGISQATAVLVGQNLGAKKPDEAGRIVGKAVKAVLIFIVTGMTLTFFFGRHLVQFFIDDPEVIALGAQQFRIVSVSVVFFSVFTVLNGAFQGGGDTKPIMILNISRLWLVRVPLAYLLIFTAGWGAAGIWWAMFASNFSVAAVNIILFRTGRWKYQLNPDTI